MTSNLKSLIEANGMEMEDDWLTIDKRQYPWEVGITDPWGLPERMDRRPRVFDTREGAILAATRWNASGPFRHVVRPRVSRSVVIAPEEFQSNSK